MSLFRTAIWLGRVNWTYNNEFSVNDVICWPLQLGAKMAKFAISKQLIP